ncbi:MAG: RNA polymerase sigma factor [Bacteroidia bacterium]
MTPKQNTERFLEVVENHKALIYKVAHAYCKDHEDRKDLIQEVLIQLWRSFERYDAQYKLSTWIYRIALNVAISWYRKTNSRAKLEAPIAEELIYLFKDAEEAEVDENLELLQAFIAQLNKLDRALILLYLEDKSQKEIAEILGLSVSNVSTKVGRIKAKLRQKFDLLSSKS